MVSPLARSETFKLQNAGAFLNLDGASMPGCGKPLAAANAKPLAKKSKNVITTSSPTRKNPKAFNYRPITILRRGGGRAVAACGTQRLT